MTAEIVLLTGDAEAPFLTNVLEEQAPVPTVTRTGSIKELEALAGRPSGIAEARLIAYCTSVIVPGSILDQLDRPAYNFHPGPPNYPGVYPANFAIYDKAAKFGVTAHVMMNKVDSGPIVAVEWFDIKDWWTAANLEENAYTALYKMFCTLAPALSDPGTDLPEIDAQWGGRKTTRQDYDALSQPVALLSDEEKDLWERAFG